MFHGLRKDGRNSMQYCGRYASPLGEILLAADELGMIGLWFEGQRYFGLGLQKDSETRETPVLETARRWLDVYFSGQEPSFSVPLHVQGTEFQQRVWRVLLTIPYGSTSTYGQIARQMAAENRGGRVSARAVGHAVGRNPVSLLVPCHRVIGADGSLTGYAGGVSRKASLLALEQSGALPPAAEPAGLPALCTNSVSAEKTR